MNIKETPCPQCSNKTLKIEMRLTVQKIGTYSIAGVQRKYAAENWPWIFCKSCGISAPAKKNNSNVLS